MQYVNWLRQAGEHGLIGNLYDLAPGPRSFLHPGLLISGVLNALGLGAIAAYLIWKPVAVVALWAGAKAWVERFVPERRRLAALALALFFCSPIAALVGWTGWGGLDTRFDFDFLSGELTTNNYLWGYLFTAVAVGPDAARDARPRAREDGAAPPPRGCSSRGSSRGRERPTCS